MVVPVTVHLPGPGLSLLAQAFIGGDAPDGQAALVRTEAWHVPTTHPVVIRVGKDRGAEVYLELLRAGYVVQIAPAYFPGEE